MGVKFTPEQQKAIDTLDKSILVAAAAGSGKTAVLVQRIINIILEGESNVDEMLVVTFTKAAAAEMRLKLSKAIKKRMQEDPDSRPVLREQLNRLYRAYISTFDSFAVRVIKEFFYLIDIEPEFKACDEIQSTLMQRAAIDELFDEAFENDELIDGGSFRDFLRLYSSDRSEEGIKEDIISSYAKLRSMPNYLDWAYERTEQLRKTKAELAGSDLEKAILVDARNVFTEAVELAEAIRAMFIEHGIEEKFYKMLGSEYDGFCQLRDKAVSGHLDEEFIETLMSFDFVNLQKTSDFFEKTETEAKAAYNEFKTQVTPLRKRYRDELLKTFRARYFLPDFDTRIQEMNDSYRYTVYYLKLISRFEEKYQNAKSEAKLLDFADMEHFAVKILENESAADALRKRFNFIFIDEYQDTNNIQEYLISRIAREDNLFKVGDVKQSIYRFRQAEPAIFERVYSEYSDDALETAEAIDLNMNFRSNGRTISYINEIFSNVMDGYDDRAKLYFGLENSDNFKPEYDLIPEVHLLYSDCDDESDSQYDADEYSSDEAGAGNNSADAEIENLSKEEAEAAYIANLVNSIIGTEFNDTVTGEIRKAEAKDVVVLLRSVKFRGDILARALRKTNISSHIEEEENYFDAVEVNIALSILQTIDNMKRDVPLIASLHSEVFGWSPEQLAEVRIAYSKYIYESEAGDASKDSDNSARNKRYRPPYWEALSWYAENGDNAALAEKSNYAIGKIKEWRNLSKMMPIEDFIWRLLVDSGYYMIVGAMYSGDRRQANLRALVDRAKKYSEESIASLSTFLDFLNVMKSKNVSNGQASMVSKDDNVVRITTIHKSKGLEYPFVIVGGMGHSFRTEHSEMKPSFDSELGVAVPYVSPDRRYWRSSLLQRAITVKSNDESYREELRVLYVAMTRARNKLYLVGTCKSEEKLLAKNGRPNNYLEVIKDSLHTPFNECFITPLDTKDSEGNRVFVKDILATRPEMMSPETLKIFEEVDRRLSYNYPDEGLLDVPAKYSVSAIRKALLEQESKAPIEQENELRDTDNLQLIDDCVNKDNEVIHLWLGTDKKKKASASDIGIAYHRIMEFMDFTELVNGKDDYIRESAEFLRDHGAIDENVFRELDLEHIGKFFNSELGRRAVNAARAGKLKKEKAFTLKTDWQGEKILVQGVIDCCWEENGRMVLIDYKSSFINPRANHDAELARLQHEYKTQIELYSKALEEGSGYPVGEAYLYLFMSDEAVII